MEHKKIEKAKKTTDRSSDTIPLQVLGLEQTFQKNQVLGEDYHPPNGAAFQRGFWSQVSIPRDITRKYKLITLPTPPPKKVCLMKYELTTLILSIEQSTSIDRSLILPPKLASNTWTQVILLFLPQPWCPAKTLKKEKQPERQLSC